MGDPITTQILIKLLLTAASVVYQQRQFKKLKEQIKDAAATRDIRRSGSNAPLPFIYGTSYIAPPPVFIDVNSTVLFQTEGANTTTIGSLPSLIAGNKNEILLSQRPLGFGEFSEINFIDVDESAYTDGDYLNWFRSIIDKAGGTANVTAPTISQLRDSDSTFDDLCFATEFFRMNRDSPQYGGLPSTGYYVTGRLVRDITRTGTEGNYTYTLSTARTYTANSARVLLDYMLDSNGASIPLSSIDLATFYDSIQICDKVVFTGAAFGGKIFGASTRDVKKHEFNGIIYTSDDHIFNIEQIVDSIPGGVLLRDALGTLKLSIPDEDLTNDEASVADITSDDLFGYVTVSSPDTNNKLNKITLEFPNVNKDFASDLYIQDNASFLALDNDVPLEANASPSGCNDMYHGEHYADTIMATSRRNSVEFTMRTWGVIIEPGDVVKIEGEALYPTALPVNQLDLYVRVVSVTPQRDLSIKVIAQEFEILDYTWGDKTDEIIEALPVFDFTVEPPTSIVVAELTGTNTNPITGVSITWDDPDDFRVTDILVEVKTGTGPFIQIATVPVGAEEFLYQSPAVEPLQFRVRSLTLYNQKSAYETQIGTITPGFEATQAITPTWSKSAIVFSEGSFTNANAVFYILDGGSKIDFVDVADDASLANNQWRVTSVTSDDTITFTQTNDFTDDEIDIAITAFTGQGAVSVNLNLKDVNGDVSSLTASIDVAQAEKGDSGQDGSFLQLRYSDDNTQPLPATYPTNDAGTNDTWTVAATNAVWFISREVTFDSDNVRTNGDWTIAKIIGDDGVSGDVFKTIYLFQNGLVTPTVPLDTEGFNVTSGVAEAVGSWTLGASTPDPGDTIYAAVATLIRVENTGNWSVSTSWLASPAGKAGTDGTDGTDAPHFATRTLYTDPALATAPSAPSATLTWSTGLLSSITDGWSETPPTQSATDLELVYSSQLVFIDTIPPFTTTTATGTTPVDGIRFDGLVSFNAGNFAIGDASITNIDGGNITTDSIKADSLDIDGSLTLGGATSGFLAGRTSLADFGTAGFYIGRTSTDGNTATGFQLSHTSVTDSSHPQLDSGTLQGIIHDDVSGMRVYEPVFYQRGTPNSGTDSTLNTVGDSLTLTAGDIHTVSLFGGGGGGGGGPDDGGFGANPGSAGGPSQVELTGATGFNGTRTFNASGGSAGAAGTGEFSGTYVPDGITGQASQYGPGGLGGPGGQIKKSNSNNSNDKNHNPMDGSDAPNTSYGAGGGGGSARGQGSSENFGGRGGGGGAVTATLITYDLTNANNDGTLTMNLLGAGGLGATRSDLSNTSAGGSGTRGIASVSSITDGYVPYSLEDIKPPPSVLGFNDDNWITVPAAGISGGTNGIFVVGIMQTNASGTDNNSGGVVTVNGVGSWIHGGAGQAFASPTATANVFGQSGAGGNIAQTMGFSAYVRPGGSIAPINTGNGTTNIVSVGSRYRSL